MSVSTISFSQAATLSTISYEKSIEFKLDRWLWVIPIVTAIAIGVLFVPYFGLGLVVGAVHLAATIVSMLILEKLRIVNDENSGNSPYERLIRKNLLSASLFVPIAEEAIMRGGIQPALIHAVQILVPSSTAAFLGSSLNIATAVSILATAAIFGAVHLPNPHKGSHIQAISAGLGGVLLGVLSSQFGLGAAIASHVAFNSLIALGASASPSHELPATYPILSKKKNIRFSLAPAC